MYHWLMIYQLVELVKSPEKESADFIGLKKAVKANHCSKKNAGKYYGVLF